MRGVTIGHGAAWASCLSMYGSEGVWKPTRTAGTHSPRVCIAKLVALSQAPAGGCGDDARRGFVV